jgi:hypothetical protein
MQPDPSGSWRSARDLFRRLVRPSLFDLQDLSYYHHGADTEHGDNDGNHSGVLNQGRGDAQKQEDERGANKLAASSSVAPLRITTQAPGIHPRKLSQ